MIQGVDDGTHGELGDERSFSNRSWINGVGTREVPVEIGLQRHSLEPVGR